MLCFSPFNNSKIDQGFRYIICDQLRPDFLLDGFWLVGVKVA